MLSRVQEFMTTPIAAVAGAGAVAAAAWLASTLALLRAREHREAAWGGALVVAALAAGALGFSQPAWHIVATGLAAGLALRNATLQAGLPRALTALGLTAWATSLTLAFALFR